VDFEMFDNTEFYANVEIKGMLTIPNGLFNAAFNIYKGNKYEMIIVNPAM